MSGYVYIMQQDETQAIKIGYSRSMRGVTSRRQQIQTSSPYPIRVLCCTPGSPEGERAFHSRFKSHRLRGEWFSPCDAIMAVIRELATMARAEPNPAAERVIRRKSAERPRRPAGVVQKKGRWYYRPTSSWEREERKARGLPETIPLGKANTFEARKKWADLQAPPRYTTTVGASPGPSGNHPSESATYTQNV